jgi:hypothetical protein
MELKFTDLAKGNNVQSKFLTSGSNNDTLYWSQNIISSKVQYRVDANNYFFDFGTLDIYDDLPHILTIYYDGTTVRAEMDGTPSPDTYVTAAPPFKDFNQFGGGVSPLANCDFYYFKYWSDNTETSLVHHWNADSASSAGAGSTLYDDGSAGNDATLTGFTLPDDWVFYDDGGGLTIIPTSIASGEVVGSPTVTLGLITLTPTTIPTEEVVGSPVVTSGGTVLSPTPITSGEFVGDPVLTPQGVTIAPIAINTEEVVGSPTLTTGLVFILPPSIPTEEAVGSPFIDTLLKEIFPEEILTAEDIGRPIVLGGDSIVIPIPDRVTFTATGNYLRTLVFNGTTNEVIAKWMLSEGFEPTFNESLYEYWGSLGYTGDFNDRYRKWRLDE